jgi:hypothetical protein
MLLRRIAILATLFALAACENNPLEAQAWRWTGGAQTSEAIAPAPQPGTTVVPAPRVPAP